METHKNSRMEIEKICNSNSFGNKKNVLTLTRANITSFNIILILDLQDNIYLVYDLIIITKIIYDNLILSYLLFIYFLQNLRIYKFIHDIIFPLVYICNSRILH